MIISSFPPLLQRFFTDRLITQQGASPHTVAGYRDTFRLLLKFAKDRLGRVPSALRLEELNAEFLEKFLEHLEHERGNRPRTRNHRLSALHAFFRYVSLAELVFSMQCQRILAIPAKRFERGPVEFLAEEEATALVAAPDAQTWIGRRDRALLLVAVQTGMRNSELTSLRCQDVELRVRRSHPLLRERPEDAMYTLEARSGQCPQGLAVGTQRRASGSGLPQFTRWTTQRRCLPAARHTTRSSRQPYMSFFENEECYTAYSSSRRGHGAASRRH